MASPQVTKLTAYVVGGDAPNQAAATKVGAYVVSGAAPTQPTVAKLQAYMVEGKYPSLVGVGKLQAYMVEGLAPFVMVRKFTVYALVEDSSLGGARPQIFVTT